MSTDARSPSGPRASFWVRLGAAIIDGLILAIPQLVIAIAAGVEVAQAVGIGISVGYFTYFEGSPSGQTIGKRGMGIRVVDLNGGGPIGHGRALVRWLGRIVSSLVLLLGYFWMLWDRERQTWHDKMANSVVVPVQSAPVEAWPS